MQKHLLKTTKKIETFLARDYLLPSPMIKYLARLKEYAVQSFRDDTPLLECVMDLATRIYTDFTYYPSSTTISASGEEKLVGTDATHAWLSVYSTKEGWVEFDPTNNYVAGEQHIITVWGRDYFDVLPLKGEIYGGGESPVLDVSVDLAR